MNKPVAATAIVAAAALVALFALPAHAGSWSSAPAFAPPGYQPAKAKKVDLAPPQCKEHKLGKKHKGAIDKKHQGPCNVGGKCKSQGKGNKGPGEGNAKLKGPEKGKKGEKGMKGGKGPKGAKGEKGMKGGKGPKVPKGGKGPKGKSS